MILLVITSLRDLRLWMLRLDHQLMTEALQERWLQRERELQEQRLAQLEALQALDLDWFATKGGEA